MTLIRVALIGLSSTAKTSWAAEGHLPYLLSSRGRSHYEIVALLNSSIRAAEAAKEQFNLPSAVKTYDSPVALAADPDIDLVVCNTRVDLHFQTTEASIRAGKAVYIEWPLTENLKRAHALVGDQNLNNSIIGLQGRVSPITLKVNEVLAEGRIGRVLSTEIRAFGSLVRRGTLPEGLAYFADRAVGGNPVTIASAHMIDYVHEVLGDFASFSARMQIQRPNVAIVGKDGSTINHVHSDVPDYLAIHGPLAPGKVDIAEDAMLAATFRSGPPFKGMPAFTWTINGEKGEILITSPSGPYLMSDSYTIPPKIELHDHATDQVTTVEWSWTEWQKELPVRSRIVGEVYERYARWWENGKATIGVPEDQDFPRLQNAISRMKEFHLLFQQFDRSRQR
ncbi:MAG: hypothetical protein Q9160_007462 [Pyrenula sp. 1 TL-2023]